MKIPVLTLLIISLSFIVKAQKVPICGSDRVNQLLMEQDPSFREKRDAFEKQWQEFNQVRGKRTIQPNNDTLYEIPVVIHVIHTGGAVGTNYNPADSQLVNWVNYVNKVYAAQYSTYPDSSSGGTYFPIRFVLAQRDSNCNPTTGIVRVNGSGISGYATYGVQYSGSNGATESQIRALSHWPERTFYNIYVVNKFDSIDPYLPYPGSSYVAGFAYFPGSGVIDGAYMLAYVSKQGNSTMPHEMGHAMGLYHTFEGGDETTCPTNTNCVTNGDKVCDTEPVKNLLFVSPCATNSQTNSCTGVNYNNTQKNIMGYGGCLDRFTPGQRDRAILQLTTLRAGLAGSVATNPPGKLVKVSSCIPTITNAGNNNGIGPCNVTLHTLSYTSGGYSSDNYRVYIDNSCMLQTVLNPTGSYTLKVTTTTNAQKVRAYIDYNNDGTFAASELILDHIGTVASETHSVTFTPAVGAVVDTPLRMRVVSDFASSATPTSCSALAYGQAEDFGVFISTSNPLPVKLILFSADPVLNEKLNSIRWQTATEFMVDHFTLERSVDGEHFAPVHQQKASGKGSYYMFNDKNVLMNQTYYYRLRSVDMDEKFSTSKIVSATLNEPTAPQIGIFPNPISGNELNYFFEMQVNKAEMIIFDISGKEVLRKAVSASSGIIDISKLSKGVYMIQLQSNGVTITTQKVVVQR